MNAVEARSGQPIASWPALPFAEESALFAGVDIGSRTTKAVVVDSQGCIIGHRIQDSLYSSGKIGTVVFEGLLEELGLGASDLARVVATGYGRLSVPWAHDTVTEITCHARGAHFVNPSARTVIDIGGQDSKVISVGENGEVVHFAMNDKCAAGCGRFLESILKHALDTSVYELNGLNLDLAQAASISSTCTVFAETEVISLLAEGTPAEAIISGLVNAVASRVGNMARRVGLKQEVVFSGGVAKNFWVKRALERTLGTEMRGLKGLDPQLVGAIGAALGARSDWLAERWRRNVHVGANI